MEKKVEDVEVVEAPQQVKPPVKKDPRMHGEGPLMVPSGDGGIDEVPREFVETLKRTVAKNATDQELVMFLSVARKYGLDPFAKEIWFMKFKNRMGHVETRVETSRDGYLRIAQRNPNYRGLQSFAVYENDDFSVVVEDGEVKGIQHRFSAKDRGVLVGAWAVVRMGEDKVYSFVPFDEYYNGKESGSKRYNPVWDTHPSAMIRKVAEVDALKRAAGITGLVTAEEMGGGGV